MDNCNKRLMALVSLFLCSLVAQASQTISLDYQQPFIDKPVQEITVEIGGYDVSQFAQSTEQGVVVDLPAMEAGVYEAYVIVYYDDGEVQTLVETDVTVAGEQPSQWHVNSSFSSQYRIAEDDRADYSLAPHKQNVGAIDAAYLRERDDVLIEARIQAAYDSLKGAHVPSNHWQLSDYQVNAAVTDESYTIGVKVGNNLVEQESLIFSNYQRRGVSFYSADQNDRFKATFFGSVSEPTNAPDEDLFFSEEDSNQTVGGSVSFSPLATDSERLMLSMSYVDGQGTTAGSGFTVVDPEAIYGGETYGVVLDSQWLNQSVRFYLEHAKSDFDSDGIGYGDSGIEDSADKWLMQLTSGDSLPSLGLDYWQMILQQQRVGEDFYSIANLGLPGDLVSKQFNVQGGKGNWSFTFDLQHQETNESDAVDKPTRTTEYSGLDINYFPVVDTTKGIWSVLGSPSINSYYHVTTNSQPDSDQLLSGMDVDNTQKEYSVGVNLSHAVWSVGLTHSLIDTEDRSEVVEQDFVEIYTPFGDTENKMTSLSFSWFPNQRVTISPQLQWNDYTEKLSGNQYTTFNTGLDTQWTILPEELLLSLNYFYGTYDNQYGDPFYQDTEQKSHTANLQLTWKAIKPTKRQPGIDLFFKGSYGKQDDTYEENEYETWQVLVGFSAYWAANQ